MLQIDYIIISQKDAWPIDGEGLGFTAFQARDLLNPISTLSERIDLILFRDNFKVNRINTVGDKQRDRAPSDLWPSDHAGVVATLKSFLKRRFQKNGELKS